MRKIRQLESDLRSTQNCTDQMSEDMLVDRDVILQDTVELMAMKEKFSLDVCVSEKIYQKYAGA